MDHEDHSHEKQNLGHTQDDCFSGSDLEDEVFPIDEEDQLNDDQFDQDLQPDGLQPLDVVVDRAALLALRSHFVRRFLRVRSDLHFVPHQLLGRDFDVFRFQEVEGRLFKRSRAEKMVARFFNLLTRFAFELDL